MSNPLPNALALSTVNDGDQAQAAPLRNNFAAIQSAVNLLRAALAGGAAGQILQAADGTDVQWLTAAAPAAVYRKATAKVVVNTVAETDLLNGEITVAAGVMSTNRAIRLAVWGDVTNNSGAARLAPQFKLKLGATTIFDTGNIGGTPWNAAAPRYAWGIEALISNQGAANSQSAKIDVEVMNPCAVVSGTFTTGTGIYVADNIAALMRGKAINATAVDTSLAQALALTVILPFASTLLDVTLKGALVEVV